MKRTSLVSLSQFLLLCSCMFGLVVQGQSKEDVLSRKSIRLGAYYFDGWTGRTKHVTDRLKNDYAERMPSWGWTTSTPEIMQKQIDLAADAGLSFFSFCWYFGRNNKDSAIVDQDPKNNALFLYLHAKNREKLDFNLMIANHQGYIFKQSDWVNLCQYWIKIFQEPGYVQVDGKPLIVFFSITSLLGTFKTPLQVAKAFDQLRQEAKQQGLKGVTIAVNCGDLKSLAKAADFGFDIVTGYNYHNEGLYQNRRAEVPIDTMQVREVRLWKALSKTHQIVPAVTLNWDRRPMEKSDAVTSPRFTGFSESSVYRSVRQVRDWIDRNPRQTTRERIAILYAWNEYAEGAWLTPTEKRGEELLKGVKRALQK